MVRDVEDLLPARPPFLPLPRFIVEEASLEGNPLNPEEMGILVKKYGSWAARLADAFAVDFPSAERIARGLSERILKRF